MLSLYLHTCIQCPWQDAGKTGGNIPQGHGERDGMREKEVTELLKQCNYTINCTEIVSV